MTESNIDSTAPLAISSPNISDDTQLKIDDATTELIETINLKLHEIEGLGGSTIAIDTANEAVLACAKFLGY